MRRSPLVLAVVVALAACHAGDGGSAVSDSAASQPSVVAEALRFTAPVVGGGELDAETLAGEPVAFWFWAPT